jgi:hypothetical protein
MSAADETGHDEESRPQDSEVETAASQEAPEHVPDPAAQSGGAGDGIQGSQEAMSSDQEGLADDSMAEGLPFAGDRSGRDRRTRDDMRSLGVDLDVPSRAPRPFNKSTDRQLSTGAKFASGGGTAIENLNITGALPSHAHSGLVGANLIQSIMDTRVITADHIVLRETLERYGAAYVSGEDGGGRLTTAYAVLAELCGTDKIVAIDLDDDADLTTVLKQGDLLRAGHGHVVELPADQPAPRKSTLTTAGGQFAGSPFYLVVIGPPGAADHTLHPYEVRHQPPGPADVLNRHLPRLLGSRTNWSAEQITTFVATCRNAPGIAERLYSSWQPGEVVQLARRLVDVGLRGGHPDEALALLPDALRKLAVDVLQDAQDDDDAHTLRRLTARIAYALFPGRQAAVVFELASWLFAALSAEEPTTSEGSAQIVKTVFDGNMENLIDDRMRAHHAEDDDDRLVRLVDPALARAVLDVVWHDYDHLRGPLVRWLQVLGRHARYEVRTRVGQLAGQLALYDFNTTYRYLLRPWARSQYTAHRQSAATAMERAVLEPKLTARVCRQVQDWALSPDQYMNDTAARAYATRLGADFADEPLTYLWLVALESGQVVSPAVAVAVSRLHDPDDPEASLAILTELARWTGDHRRSLHVHAARALTLLAHRAASPPHDQWPSLLRLAAEDQEARDLLLGLWRTALTEFRVAIHGWQMLLVWLLRPDEVDELFEFTLEFATDLLNTPMLRTRAVFYLSQWLSRQPDAPVLRRLRDNL